MCRARGCRCIRKDERDFGAPIVSVSLGLPATFLFGGPKRADKTAAYRLEHGDVVVWGGPSRLFFHGVAASRRRACDDGPSAHQSDISQSALTLLPQGEKGRAFHPKFRWSISLAGSLT